jgi:predicted  nucleic acid-binding Zn-ribbon protein
LERAKAQTKAEGDSLTQERQAYEAEIKALSDKLHATEEERDRLKSELDALRGGFLGEFCAFSPFQF